MTAPETSCPQCSRPVSVRHSDCPHCGHLLPTLEVLGEIGRGGMGVVYRAWHRVHDQEVALKRVLTTGGPDTGLIRRFRQEARAVAKLREHPNVVTVHHADWDEDGPFMVMEFVGGGSLEGLLRRWPRGLPPGEAHRLFLGICAGVGAAHAQGVVHRDLKPGNVLLTREGQPKVCDFGLARTERGPSPFTLQGERTQAGVGMGTLGYMAPEQARDAASADHRADIYSLGCLFYRMVTGQHPPMHPLYIPEAWRATILRATLTLPEDRFRDVGELVASLPAARTLPDPRTPPGSWPEAFRSAPTWSVQPGGPPGPASTGSSGTTSSRPGVPAPHVAHPAPGAAAGGGPPRQPASESSRWARLPQEPELSLEDFDDLFEESSRWARLPQEPEPRRRSAGGGRYLLLSVLVLAILGAGIWLGREWSAPRDGPERPSSPAPEPRADDPARPRAKEPEDSRRALAGVRRDYEREHGWWKEAHSAQRKRWMAATGAFFRDEMSDEEYEREKLLQDALQATVFGGRSIQHALAQQPSAANEDLPALREAVAAFRGARRLREAYGALGNADALVSFQKLRDGAPMGPVSPELERLRTHWLMGRPAEAVAAWKEGLSAVAGGGRVRFRTGAGGVMIRVAPGRFRRGSPPGEVGRQGDEGAHEVVLTKTYYLGRCELTQAEWTAVMGTAPWEGEASVKRGPRYPAANLSWQDARQYCEKLTAQDRKQGILPATWEYRLPTEAEWERACRAEGGAAYTFGDDASGLGEHAWFIRNSLDEGRNRAHRVGMKRPNAWGFHDLHGNVCEWVADWSGPYPTGTVTDPTGPKKGTIRVLRGGAHSYPASSCRSADRDGNRPDVRNPINGFRLAASPVR